MSFSSRELNQSDEMWCRALFQAEDIMLLKFFCSELSMAATMYEKSSDDLSPKQLVDLDWDQFLTVAYRIGIETTRIYLMRMSGLPWLLL